MEDRQTKTCHTKQGKRERLNVRYKYDKGETGEKREGGREVTYYNVLINGVSSYPSYRINSQSY